MRNSFVFSPLLLLLSVVSMVQVGGTQAAQSKASATGSSQAMSTAESSMANRQVADIRSGTKITAQLESAVDTKTAKPGSEVAARVTKDVKQDGRIVIGKGDRLLGRVNAVEAGATAKAGSRLDVTFDRLVRGSQTLQLNTVVAAVLSTPGEQAAASEPMMAPEPVAMPSPAAGAGAGTASTGRAAASGGGGLLGGVSSTVNSTVNATAGAVGSTAAEVAGMANAAGHGTLDGSTASTLATPRNAIRVGSQAQSNEQAGLNSVFSTRQKHLRLDSGTALQFRVAAQGEARTQSK